MFRARNVLCTAGVERNFNSFARTVTSGFVNEKAKTPAENYGGSKIVTSIGFAYSIPSRWSFFRANLR
ncbi:hypothetical protein FHS72_000269 [Loktanella ponticola]|uniref:Uncharacterized protein n=1 Tax=Yoonia ponticola TaxID=1524255 RepID=A0A7W9BHS4_9RHOB|nr:hypothetical protein [Yoonia ponticola]